MTGAGIALSPIACPPWCVVDRGAHLADLVDWGGVCVHQSRRVALDETLWPRCEMYVGSTSLIDGTPDTDDPQTTVQIIQSGEDGGDASLDDVENYAVAILELVRDARA